MTKLQDLYDRQGQSPWLDNLRRDWIEDGTLADWVARGVRGVTSNPSIFRHAIEGQEIYDAQLRALTADGMSVEDAYWELVITDIANALEILRPVHDGSDGVDGFVSIEVAPAVAHDTRTTVEQAREFHERLASPNLYVKIPATAAGIPAIEESIAAGRRINITLLFSLSRYDEVIEAYLSGLERYDGDLAPVVSVASFFVSRIDSAVDAELDKIGSPEALALKGKAAVANAQLAYDLFQRRFSGPRWEALAARGARVQRPLWASTSTKNPTYPATLYVDSLIAPDTVNTMPEGTLTAFETGGTLARTADADFDTARKVLEDLAGVGVDLDAVTARLEDEGVAAFESAYTELIESLDAKVRTFGTRP